MHDPGGNYTIDIFNAKGQKTKSRMSGIVRKKNYKRKISKTSEICTGDKTSIFEGE